MNTVLSIAILVVLIIQGRRIMAQLQDVREILARIDAATNAIAVKLKKAADTVEAGGMSTEDETTVVAELRTAAERLDGLAADPANPVPAEPAPVAPEG